MRVLFSAIPEAGHLNPLLPLAHALAERGHAVAFASAPAFARRAQDAGFAAYPVGDGLDAWFAELARRVGGPPGEGLAPEEIESWFLPRLFAQVGAERTLAPLFAVVAAWRPDLLVHDPCQFAAPLAATLAGVPHVTHGLGPLTPVDVFERAGEAAAPLWRAHRLQPPPYAGIFVHAYLAVSPRSLEGPLPAALAGRVWPLRPVGYDGSGPRPEAPTWLDALPDRPTVYATLGTFLNTDLAVFRAILDGLGDQDLNLIVTVGENNDPADLGPAPPNARVERYIPQSVLLDRCAAVVCHGGSGTILPALARGIPLLLLPQGADNFTNAARCEQAGVGLTLRPGGVSADAIRAGLRRLLADASYRDHARRVADEIAAMPLPRQVVDRLEQLAPGAPSSPIRDVQARRR
ncbi:MAG TPA: glycosyltransferase [Chloroflexota bacterium]|nr:glycosyltransferase [Chloroflexota bacterium]